MSNLDLPSSEAVPCLRHPQTETRLRCTECAGPICPQCMVMYEVGFKCPGCAKKRPNHAQQVDTSHYVIGFAGGFVAGQVYGWLFPWLSLTLGMFRFFGIPVLFWGLSYVLGQLTGRLMQRGLRYKYQTTLTGTILLSAVIGLLFTPFQQALQVTWDTVQSAMNAGNGTSIELFLLGSGLNLFSAAFFLRGLAQPFRNP